MAITEPWPCVVCGSYFCRLHIQPQFTYWSDPDRGGYVGRHRCAPFTAFEAMAARERRDRILTAMVQEDHDAES